MTREEKMKKRRESGKTYEYKPNPCKEGTVEYEREKCHRAEKVRNSGNHTEYAKMKSLDARLDNYLKKMENIRKSLRESSDKSKTTKENNNIG